MPLEKGQALLAPKAMASRLSIQRSLSHPEMKIEGGGWKVQRAMMFSSTTRIGESAMIPQ